MVRNRLLIIRLQMGYKKQKDFSDFIGVSYPKYSKYENNKEQPPIDVFYKIATKLDMRMEDLIEVD